MVSGRLSPSPCWPMRRDRAGFVGPLALARSFRAVFLTQIPESLEKAVRIDSPLKRRAVGDPGLQDAHGV
jgi:hypothetical protein